MSIARKLKGLISYYRQGGMGEVLLRLSAYGYLPKALFSLTACHVFALGPLNLRSLTRPLRGYHFERANRESLDELMACQGPRPETPRAFLADLFDAGHECFVARHAGEVVAYFWTFRGFYLLRFDDQPGHALMFRLPEGGVFLGNGFIAHAHRLRGLFPHLVNFVAAQYPGGRCFSSVHHTNLGSLQAHRRVGFLPLLIVACAGFGSRTVFYRSTDKLRPRAFLSFGQTTIDIADYLRESESGTPKIANSPRQSLHG
jgi:hypothetical protein